MRPMLPLLLGALLLGGVQGAVPNNASGKFSGLHAQQLAPYSGRPLVVKRAACQAPGRPEALGVMVLEDASPLTYRVVRLEYNDHGGEMLAGVAGVEHLRGHYRKYVTEHQPVNKLLLHALISTWRWFGLKFNWEKVDYRCQLEE